MSPRRKADANLPIDVYARISLDPDNDAQGVDRQVRQCVAHLKKLGLKVGRTFIDNDTSAMSRKKRPEYEAMLARIRNRESGGVCGYHLKRILRKTIDMESLIEVVEGTGARVITIMSSELDLNTASGRGIGRVMAAFGTMEVEELSERLQGYFHDRSTRGVPHRRGVTPFGYKDDWQTPEPKEAKLVKELFKRVIEGWTLGAIAKDWHERDVKTRTGKSFTSSGLKSLIDSPRLVGDATYKGEVVAKGDWEPIITKDVQRAAQAALKSRQTHFMPNGTARRARLLSSIILCDGCERPLQLAKSDGEMYYRCNTIGCGGVMVKAEYAEREVEGRFLSRLADPKAHKALDRLRRQAPDTRALIDEIDAVKLDLEALAVDHGNGDISRSEWMTARKGLTKRLEEAETELSRAVNDPALLAATPQEILRRWVKLDLDERRRRLTPYVGSIRVKSLNGKGGRNFIPERIAVAWRI